MIEVRFSSGWVLAAVMLPPDPLPELVDGRVPTPEGRWYQIWMTPTRIGEGYAGPDEWRYPASLALEPTPKKRGGCQWCHDPVPKGRKECDACKVKRAGIRAEARSRVSPSPPARSPRRNLGRAPAYNHDLTKYLKDEAEED